MWEIELLIEGKFFSIYAIKKPGVESFEAKKNIEELIPNKKQQKQVLNYFFRLFERIADTGSIHNKEQFRQVRGSIYEFKKKTGIRIMCFIRKRTIYLLHGFKKERQKTPKKEIEKAEQLIKQISQYWEVNNG